jgi:redox-sensing transcriptional repressor
MAGESIKVPKFTLKRLPSYYRCLRTCLERKQEYVSSEQIARAAQVNAVQVRKDLTLFGTMGTPGVGYRVTELKLKLEEILGLNNVNEAALIGVGRLGRAIIDYPGFERYGLHIVALFDSNPNLVGTEIGGRRIFATNEILHIIRRLQIKVAIITVPAEWAQSVTNVLIEAGVKAIWNFAPAVLEVPPDVVLRNEDLAAGLATLFHFLVGRE